MKYSRIIPVLIVSGLLFFSCTKDFQELNTTPDKPTTTTIQPLVNHIISTLFLSWQEQASAHNDWYYPTTQLGGITSGSGYVLANAVNEIWTDYYNTLENINAVQDKINMINDTLKNKKALDNIQAILYILKAYKTFRVTDQFGDIPYFDAGKAYTGDIKFYRPKYDDQKDIYLDCLKNLDWASKNIVTNPAGNTYVSMGSFDTFFKGNMMLWLKFANSLRLRYAMQMVEKDPTDAAPIIKDVVGGNLPVITDGLDNTGDVGMWPAQLNNYDIASRPWSFNSHKFERMSTTFWNMVSTGTNSADIFDPRAVLFCETNQAGKWAPYKIGSTESDATNPYDTKRDNDYSDKSGCVFSPFNYHLIRDEHYIPELIFTAAEVHFLKAEAYARGLGVGKDLNAAQTEYYAGITSSVNFWYNIAHHTNADTYDDWAAVAPPMPTGAQMNAFLANPKVAFTGSDDDKLNKIYAQEWLSFFREPWLAFNLWRRTGRTPRDGNPSAYATFYRIPYPNSESINNTTNFRAEIGKIGSNGTDVKVWWMK
ncbi:MAG TPA: SusD/RagB family nutrient-binding outer membrane lipoprotein [Chitinophagaceae bacterium]|jgi:hypothetical protein|nr:SusD/RagB family nutrient-binding outer membrane lipoprotein [Chitinophagaceae bacterium]